MGDERGRTKKEWDEWWDELGQDQCDPVGYMGDDKLAEECKKFFTKYHWYWMSQMTMERYQGFTNEIAMRLCMNSYARYLLRGFTGHPDWTNQTALEAAKLPAERRAADRVLLSERHELGQRSHRGEELIRRGLGQLVRLVLQHAR